MHVSTGICDVIKGETGMELSSDIHPSANAAGLSGGLGLPEFSAIFI